MADSRLREILEPLNELRSVAPPSDAAQRSLARVRESLAPERGRVMRPMPWIIAAGAVAATVVILFRPSAPIASKVEPSAAQLLQRAVSASNTFRGLVQVRLSDVTVDEQGNPAAPPVVVSATIQTDRPVPIIIQQSGQEVSNPARTGRQVMPVEANSPPPVDVIARMKAIASQRPGPVTMLIPLTWEGVHTIPIPLTWEGVVVRPLSIKSPEEVTRYVTENSDVYHISEKLPVSSLGGSPAMLQIGTVDVDRSTGLIRNVDMNSYEQGTLHRQQIDYFYHGTSSPTTQPREKPSSGNRGSGR